MMTVTIEDIDGSRVNEVKAAGYHAYHANTVTAIEVETYDKDKAIRIASRFGKVLYAFV